MPLSLYLDNVLIILNIYYKPDGDISLINSAWMFPGIFSSSTWTFWKKMIESTCRVYQKQVFQIKFKFVGQAGLDP